MTYVLIATDPHRAVRSLAARHGFHDPEHAGELATVFDGAGRTIRFLKPKGVSLDAFGEILYDRGVTDRRLSPAEVYDLLAETYDSKPSGRKASKRPTVKRVTDMEVKARKMRSRKWICPGAECGQIVRGTRSTTVYCGMCFEMRGEMVSFVRVDPLPEEIAAMAGAAE